jgi:hypothetical protein
MELLSWYDWVSQTALPNIFYSNPFASTGEGATFTVVRCDNVLPGISLIVHLLKQQDLCQNDARKVITTVPGDGEKIIDMRCGVDDAADDFGGFAQYVRARKTT